MSCQSPSSAHTRAGTPSVTSLASDPSSPFSVILDLINSHSAGESCLLPLPPDCLSCSPPPHSALELSTQIPALPRPHKLTLFTKSNQLISQQTTPTHLSAAPPQLAWGPGPTLFPMPLSEPCVPAWENDENDGPSPLTRLGAFLVPDALIHLVNAFLVTPACWHVPVFPLPL